MPRFVVLRHELPSESQRASHWDVMFDAGAALRTWAIEGSPDGETASEAVSLADHRREYLDYEGPVAGNRGSVARWDWGDYEILHDDATEFVVRVAGEKLRGTIRITPRPDGRYRYTPAGTGSGEEVNSG